MKQITISVLILVFFCVVLSAGINSPIKAMDSFYKRLKPHEGQHELIGISATSNAEFLAIQNKTNCEVWIGTKDEAGNVQWRFSVDPQKAYTTKKAGDLCR